MDFPQSERSHSGLTFLQGVVSDKSTTLWGWETIPSHGWGQTISHVPLAGTLNPFSRVVAPSPFPARVINSLKCTPCIMYTTEINLWIYKITPPPSRQRIMVYQLKEHNNEKEEYIYTRWLKNSLHSFEIFLETWTKRHRLAFLLIDPKSKWYYVIPIQLEAKLASEFGPLSNTT